MPEPPLCNICAMRPSGSREHLPGVAAANDGPVTIVYFKSNSARRNTERVERREKDGFVVHTICNHCNSRTGGNFGTAYKEFVTQFSNSGMLDTGQARTWISLRTVQPLRILKQMTSMFIAVQGQFPRENWMPSCDFVLNKDAKLVQPSLRYYLYRNVSAVGRVTALTSIMSIYRRWPPIFFCEISWPPVGLVFAKEAHPLLRGMADITHWGQYGFRDRADLSFSVPQLRVASHWPLGFGSDREAHDWSARDGIVALIGPSIGDDPDAQMSVLSRRSPHRPA